GAASAGRSAPPWSSESCSPCRSASRPRSRTSASTSPWPWSCCSSPRDSWAAARSESPDMAETVRMAETPAAGTVRGPRAGHLRSLAPFPLIVVAGLILPWVTSGAGLFLWELIVIQVVFALGTNLLVGHANIHTFGQAAFYGVGGYAAAVLALEGWNAWLALIAAIVLGSPLGGFVGGLTMRMTGMGTLMVTVAGAQCFSMLSGRLSVFGGDNGLSAIANGFPSTVGVSYWYLLLGICLVAIALMWVIVHSPFGAVL